MEPPFRYPIRDFHDLERLFTAIGACYSLVPGSLRLTEGADVLARFLTEECREHDRLRLDHAQTPGGLIGLFRCLWNHPLDAPLPCVLRLEATLKSNPSDHLYILLEVPARGARPCKVLAGVYGDTEAQERLATVYRSIAMAARLTLEQA